MSIEKKQVLHFSEIGTDEETARLMPGFEIQYIVTDETVNNDCHSVFGHCVFPPKSQHFAHKHMVAEEVVYVIKGRVVNGSVDEQGVATEHECGPGVATFVKKGQIHWTRNPYDEPCEFVFAYYNTTSLHKSQYVDLTKDVPVENVPVSGKITLKDRVDSKYL